MKLRLLVCLALALVCSASALAAGAPPVAGRAYLVENASTGEVLAGSAAHRALPIASITKLMTVLVTLEHARPDEIVTVDAAAARIGESTIGLRAGERLSVGDLIRAALIQSANDAADALAEYVGRGSTPAFVALMNAKARALGLHDTHFVRPDGLDAPGHLSSAADVVHLAEVAMHQPLIRNTVRLQSASIAGGRTLHTWDDLLATFPGLLGVKTGHTGDAGWCQVAAARGHGLTVYAVLLGSPTRSQRNADLSALLAWGLARYRVVPVIDANRTYATAGAGWGKHPVRLVAEGSAVRSVRVDRRLVERVVAPAVVSLPVRRGEQLGEVRVYDGKGTMIASRPLVAAESRSRPGVGGRVGWYAGRTAHHVWGWFS